MQKPYILIVSALFGCLAASAAPVDSCGFEKVPRDALIALHEARGKPFTAGAVFVNGKYLPPPYVVSRYGTAIAINGHQVTGQVIPWSRFTGAKAAPAASSRSSAAGRSDSSERYEEATSLDDLFADDDAGAAGAADDDSIDDLFDDNPKPKPKPKPRPAPAPKAPAPAAAPPSEPEDPSAPPQKFTHTARTRQLLETLDKQRTTIDRDLRSNQFYFFSPRYSSVRGNLRILESMVEKLPDAMRDATSADDLFARMRRAGLGFVSAEVCTDLYANKLTFPALYELRSRVREEVQRRKELTAEATSY